MNLSALLGDPPYRDFKGLKGNLMMTNEGGRPTPTGKSPNPRQGGGAGDGQSLSTRGLVIVLASLATAMLLGYLLLNKLVDMSQEEDCALAHRYNCGAVEVPR